MAETKKRLYNRSTLQRKLSELLKRVTSLNSGLDGTFEYLYYVKKLVVFGSYLDEAKDKMHDLDIGFELALKPKYSNYKIKELEAARLSTMPEYYLTAYNGLLRSMWPTEEVLRYLKDRSGIYSFHPLDDANERKIILGSKHRTVYNIDRKGEKERLHSLFESNKHWVLCDILNERGDEVFTTMMDDFESKIRNMCLDISDELNLGIGDTLSGSRASWEACGSVVARYFSKWIKDNIQYFKNNITEIFNLENILSEFLDKELEQS